MSSISERMPYSTYLKSIFTTNPEEINVFKRNPSYQSVVTCGPAIVYSPQTETVKKYCNRLIHNSIPFIDIIPSIVEIDNSKGDPCIEEFDFPKIGKFKAQGSLMHVLHDAIEIESIMKNLDNFSIIELGPAYGLMYEVLNKRFDNIKYKGIDLEYSCKLMKYCVGDRPNCEIIDCNTLTNDEEEHDIFISLYAITECDIEIQKKYFYKYIKLAKRGYIMGSHNEEILKMIKEYHPDMFIINNEKRCATNITGSFKLCAGLDWGPLVVWGYPPVPDHLK